MNKPKGLTEISITFLLVAQLVTEKKKETRQHFKAKTYKCDSRYCVSVLLNHLISKQFCMLFYIFSALFVISLTKGVLASYMFLGALTQHNYIPSACKSKAVSMTPTHYSQAPVKLDHQWSFCTNSNCTRLRFVFVCLFAYFYCLETTFKQQQQQQTIAK